MGFQTALSMVFENEGGLQTLDQAKRVGDPGGETKYGITQHTLDGFDRALYRLPELARDLTQEQAERIYSLLFWVEPRMGRVDLWAPGVALFMFDAGVQHGPGLVARAAQRIVGGVVIDGVIGKYTLWAFERYGALPLLLDLAQWRRRLVADWVQRNPKRERLRAGIAKRIDRTLRQAVFEEIVARPTQQAVVLWGGRGVIPGA